ncbi:hypothetical protein RFI_11952 [Reticulomyxa filosa]|uniref:Uncharacterized protein n=1 Tax=Reticulomyxa filosa TaxID=46433 RepID=X6NGR5_RETFI|nr:hypothetical protein RFI_11952 [Reticulomyxa filosa]|eukprot:ETO25186.1 hypothetical protein RFI_11952 [Reticulomyxa filosa]
MDEIWYDVKETKQKSNIYLSNKIDKQCKNRHRGDRFKNGSAPSQRRAYRQKKRREMNKRRKSVRQQINYRCEFKVIDSWKIPRKACNDIQRDKPFVKDKKIGSKKASRRRTRPPFENNPCSANGYRHHISYPPTRHKYGRFQDTNNDQSKEKKVQACATNNRVQNVKLVARFELEGLSIQDIAKLANKKIHQLTAQDFTQVMSKVTEFGVERIVLSLKMKPSDEDVLEEFRSFVVIPKVTLCHLGINHQYDHILLSVHSKMHWYYMAHRALEAASNILIPQMYAYNNPPIWSFDIERHSFMLHECFSEHFPLDVVVVTFLFMLLCCIPYLGSYYLAWINVKSCDIIVPNEQWLGILYSSWNDGNSNIVNFHNLSSMCRYELNTATPLHRLCSIQALPKGYQLWTYEDLQELQWWYRKLHKQPTALVETEYESQTVEDYIDNIYRFVVQDIFGT